ncbi:MAG: bacterial transcriptional activator domain-containing protein [Bacillota bacterium]
MLCVSDLYRKAISLYRGEYLPECPYQEWVLPARHYYRRIYLKCVSSLVHLLNLAGLSMEKAERVLERIKNGFSKKNTVKGVIVDSSVQSFHPEQPGGYILPSRA